MEMSTYRCRRCSMRTSESNKSFILCVRDFTIGVGRVVTPRGLLSGNNSLLFSGPSISACRRACLALSSVSFCRKAVEQNEHLKDTKWYW